MTAPSRKPWLIATGIAMVALWIALGALERSLPDGTPGVIEFEFVGSEERATEMLAEWGDAGRDDIRLSLWLDYGFMLAYGAFFTLAALATRDFARRSGRGTLAAAGRLAPYCAAAAAVFDAGENTFLLLVLGGHGGPAAPVLATVCASVKWVLITLAVAYVVWGLVSRLLLSRRQGASTARGG
jgi:hypothetical protein